MIVTQRIPNGNKAKTFILMCDNPGIKVGDNITPDIPVLAIVYVSKDTLWVEVTEDVYKNSC